VDLLDRRFFDDLRHQKRDQRLKKYARKYRQEPRPAASANGVVGAVHAGLCVVHVSGEHRLCRSISGVAPGDEVHVERNRVLGIAPRRTVLSRPDPSNPRIERVIAANIDVAIVVSSVASPPFRPGLIDRVLIAIERGGITPIVCLNKIDLAGSSDASRDWDAAGTHVVRCSAAAGAGLHELAAALRSRTAVFVGHSGVGKSSLINALFPGVGLATAATGKKGRHTTTSSFLHEEPDGTRVIDTPGVREFGLVAVTAGDLRGYFPEFSDAAKLCRFSDCSHTHEPDCAVRDGNFERYARYLRILDSLGPRTSDN
jgi:ribosome biogenesis GTPase